MGQSSADRRDRVLRHFFATAETEFAWLGKEYGFRELSRDSKFGVSRPLFASILWANSKTFVQIVLEFPRPAIDVQFGPLKGGRPPGVFDDTGRFHLSGLVLFKQRDPNQAAQLEHIEGLRKGQISKALRNASKTLRELGAEILAGDQSLYRELALLGDWQAALSH